MNRGAGAFKRDQSESKAADRESCGGRQAHIRCFKCGGGHMAADCDFDERVCFNCRRPGHVSVSCPERRQARGAGRRTKQSCSNKTRGSRRRARSRSRSTLSADSRRGRSRRGKAGRRSKRRSTRSSSTSSVSCSSSSDYDERRRKSRRGYRRDKSRKHSGSVTQQADSKSVGNNTGPKGGRARVNCMGVLEGVINEGIASCPRVAVTVWARNRSWRCWTPDRLG